MHSSTYMSGKHFLVDANVASASSVPVVVILSNAHLVITAAIDSVQVLVFSVHASQLMKHF